MERKGKGDKERKGSKRARRQDGKEGEMRGAREGIREMRIGGKEEGRPREGERQGYGRRRMGKGKADGVTHIFKLPR